jgi:hypothetical protein
MMAFCIPPRGTMCGPSSASTFTRSGIIRGVWTIPGSHSRIIRNRRSRRDPASLNTKTSGDCGQLAWRGNLDQFHSGSSRNRKATRPGRGCGRWDAVHKTFSRTRRRFGQTPRKRRYSGCDRHRDQRQISQPIRRNNRITFAGYTELYPKRWHSLHKLSCVEYILPSGKNAR